MPSYRPMMALAAQSFQPVTGPPGAPLARRWTDLLHTPTASWRPARDATQAMGPCPGRATAKTRRRFRRFGRPPHMFVLNKQGGIQAIFWSRRHDRLTGRGAIRGWQTSI